MISPDRIIEAVRALTQSQDDSGTQEEVPVKVARQRAEVRGIRERFDSKKNNLMREARQQHEVQFTPLRTIIDPLIPTMQALRDTYFPGRPIAVGNVYRKPMLLSERSSHYTRGLMIPVMAEDSRRIIYAIATCDDPSINSFLGIRMSKLYYLNIGEYDEYDKDKPSVFGDESLWWIRSRDEIVDMNEHFNPFFITMDPKGKGKIDFSWVNDFLPQLSGSDLKAGIPVADPATFVAENAEVIEGRFIKLLAPWARRQLLAQASAV